jgi:hypothetical protein
MTRIVIVLMFLAGVARAQTPKPPAQTIVKAARLFDGTGDRWRANLAVLVEGDRIKAIGAAADLAKSAPGATVIDLGDVTLQAGQYIVVARNRDAFAQRYGAAGINLAAGQFTKSLDNASDRIELVDAVNQHIHDFTYFDTWHPTTDGEGPTLVVADPNQPIEAFDTAAGWRPSTAVHGSPGRADGPDTIGPIATCGTSTDRSRR